MASRCEMNSVKTPQGRRRTKLEILHLHFPTAAFESGPQFNLQVCPASTEQWVDGCLRTERANGETCCQCFRGGDRRRKNDRPTITKLSPIQLDHCCRSTNRVGKVYPWCVPLSPVLQRKTHSCRIVRQPPPHRCRAQHQGRFPEVESRRRHITPKVYAHLMPNDDDKLAAGVGTLSVEIGYDWVTI